MKTFNAKREAISRRNGQDRLNNDEHFEVAYSPSFNTVGCRHEPSAFFLIFNTSYPHYGIAKEKIKDWVSVGVSYSTGEKGKRRFHLKRHYFNS